MSFKRIFLLLFVVLLFSCTKEGFTLYSTKLYRNIEIDGGKRREDIVIETDLDEKNQSERRYTYLLSSPDGDLRWEGELTLKDGRYLSDPLLLTPGALFEDGEYTLYIYSDGGTSETISVNIAKEEGDYSYENASKKNDAVVTYYDSEENKVDSPVDDGYAVITYTDRYSNKIKLKTSAIGDEPLSSDSVGI